MASKLEPCLFCGKRDWLARGELVNNTDELRYFVACIRVGCVERCSAVVFANFRTGAARDWNKAAKDARHGK